MIIFLSPPQSAKCENQESNEYQIKAAVLLNFAKFIEWPEQAFKSETDPLIVGVIGEDQITEAFANLSGKVANGRRIQVKRFANVKTITFCHLLFACRSQDQNFRKVLPGLGPGVLTVGESEQFAETGGMINVRITGNKVVFDINQRNAVKAGLRISSKLLHLARVVWQ